MYDRDYFSRSKAQLQYNFMNDIIHISRGCIKTLECSKLDKIQEKVQWTTRKMLPALVLLILEFSEHEDKYTEYVI